MVFSEQLSKLRKEANLTQEMLAEKCEVSRQAVAKDEGLATQLRTEIKKSRLVFYKKVVDELLALTIDFAYYSGYMMGREEYKEIFAGETYDRYQKQIYCDVIIPQRYDKIEEILGEYLDLP